jgi:chemotaxis protein CheD
VTTPIFLAPGTICCPAEPAVVSTILGSCVAVCLWDKQLGLGGMNHFLLPRCGDATPSARYGDVSVRKLLEAMERLGCEMANLRAKVFGGAAVLPYGSMADTIGTQNVNIALEALHGCGIPVLARRTGGQRGFFIRFHTALGRVMVRELAAPPGSAAALASGAGSGARRSSEQDVRELR